MLWKEFTGRKFVFVPLWPWHIADVHIYTHHIGTLIDAEYENFKKDWSALSDMERTTVHVQSGRSALETADETRESSMNEVNDIREKEDGTEEGGMVIHNS